MINKIFKSFNSITLRKIAFSLVLISSVPYISGCDSQPVLPERGVCAHRGANDTHPENTLAAFKEAIRLGAHMIEFDVRITKDGELIIIHDNTLSRTTNGQGKVSDFTLSEIKKLDAGEWKDAKFKGEKIPTLSEALDIMPKNIWLNVHLKGKSEIGKKAAELIIKKERQHQAFLACKTDAANAARKVDNHIKICNMERLNNSEDYVNETISMKADFIQLKNRADTLLAELVPKLKECSIRINYFGLRKEFKKWSFGSLNTNSLEKMIQLYDSGVDFPLVDELDKMMSIINKLGIKPIKPIFRGKND